MTSSWRQLRALMALRWQMARAPGLKTVLTLVPFLVVWLLYAAVNSAPQLNAPAMAAAVDLAPAAYLGFAVLAIVAPLTAGGGNELVPSVQLVAFPVRSSTQFLGGLLLAPVNLVWVVQLLVLAAETSYLTVGSNRLTGVVTTTAFVLCATAVGQTVAWFVVGLRQTSAGRRLVATLAATTLVGAVILVRLGGGDAVLEGSFVRLLVGAVAAGPTAGWAGMTAALLACTLLGLVAGSRLCGWALSQPGDVSASRPSSDVRRRGPQHSTLKQLIAIDRASVWRAPALRRGGLVLALLPSLVALGAALPWQALAVLPGLVAAGAGLLFGINAFCLDGSGAVWLASLPHDPKLIARAKLSVLTETVGGAVLIAALTGSLRSPGWPTPTEAIAIAMSGLACGALVIATCMALSVHRPHRADLNGPRDAIAPPGALTAASAKLAIPAGFVGLLFEGASATQRWWFPVLIGGPVVIASALWLRRSLAAYGNPAVRARVVSVVASG